MLNDSWSDTSIEDFFSLNRDVLAEELERRGMDTNELNMSIVAIDLLSQGAIQAGFKLQERLEDKIRPEYSFASADIYHTVEA
jgi:hypothetical protein